MAAQLAKPTALLSQLSQAAAASHAALNELLGGSGGAGGGKGVVEAVGDAVVACGRAVTGAACGGDGGARRDLEGSYRCGCGVGPALPAPRPNNLP